MVVKIETDKPDTDEIRDARSILGSVSITVFPADLQ